MPGLSDPQTLLSLLRTGDEDAAQQVFDTYVNSLLRLARRRISQRLARRIDAEDIVQSVFRSFFSGARDGRFTLEEKDDLGKLLTRITVRKALRQVARHTAAKRDCAQEGDCDTPFDLADLPAAEPSAETTIAFVDLLEHFLAALRPQDREVLGMRLEGYRTHEIARKLGTSDRHVRRVLEYIRAVAEEEALLA